MSQHIDPTPKQTDLTSLNSKITSGEFYKLDQGYMMESYAGAGTQPANLNTITHGLVYVGNSTQNRPEDYCIILAFCVGNYVSQLGFGVTSQNVYYRQGRATGTDFTAWKNISG